MYADYFGLRELPFSIAPNPRFLYMSDAHQEALAHLLYGLDRTGGFIVLTGEVGTGKTTLSRRALENAPKEVRIAFIITPNLAPEQLLETICDELEIQYNEGESIRKLTDRIQRDLIAHHGDGKHTVLIIDEAQNMRRETLEQIRMLTNLETNEEKLLRIILIGQPELTELLRQDDMRQLRQRVTGAYHLIQLNENDTRSYIESRLNTAGANGPIFSAAAFKKIYKLSKGVPRLINIICDRAMLGAYSHNENLVSATHVQRAYDELSSLESPKRFYSRQGPLALLAIILLVGLLYFITFLRKPNPAALPAAVDTTAPQTAITFDTVHFSQGLSLNEAFGLLTGSIVGRTLNNCNELATTDYHCAGYKFESLDEIVALEPPFLIELNDGDNLHYWVLRQIDETHVTLDNGSTRFNLLPEDFSSQGTGRFLLLVSN